MNVTKTVGRMDSWGHLSVEVAAGGALSTREDRGMRRVPKTVHYSPTPVLNHLFFGLIMVVSFGVAPLVYKILSVTSLIDHGDG